MASISHPGLDQMTCLLRRASIRTMPARTAPAAPSGTPIGIDEPVNASVSVDSLARRSADTAVLLTGLATPEPVVAVPAPVLPPLVPAPVSVPGPPVLPPGLSVDGFWYVKHQRSQRPG